MASKTETSSGTRGGIPPVPEQPLRDDMVLDYVDTAAYLQATPRQIIRWIDEGRLGCILLHARARRVLGRHVREFIASAEERTPSPAPTARPKVRSRRRGGAS